MQKHISTCAAENMSLRMVRIFLSSTFVDMFKEREVIVRHVLALLLYNASIGHDALYLLVRFEVCRVLVGNAGQFGHDLAGEEVAADVDKGSD